MCACAWQKGAAIVCLMCTSTFAFSELYGKILSQDHYLSLRGLVPKVVEMLHGGTEGLNAGCDLMKRFEMNGLNISQLLFTSARWANTSIPKTMYVRPQGCLSVAQLVFLQNRCGGEAWHCVPSEGFCPSVS